MALKVETPVFEGPLDLLIYLIKKREVSIYDIPIAEITEEFLNYIRRMRELNIPLASEFLLMAATLTRIKSEYLIPGEEQEDPRRELVQIIEEYLKSRKAAQELEKLEERASLYFSHDPSDLVFQFQDRVKIANTPDDLKEAFENLLERRKSRKVRIGIRISSESFKISEKVEEIREVLKESCVVPFSCILERSSCRLEAITYFLAILELAKRGEVATFTEEGMLFISKVFPVNSRVELVIMSG